LDPDNTKYSNKLAELQAESNIQKRMRASEVAKAAARRKAMAKTRAQKPKPTKKEVPGEVQPIFAE
jgi:hypothetical protein